MCYGRCPRAVVHCCQLRIHRAGAGHYYRPHIALLFDQIPEEYLTAASNPPMMFVDR